jgi:hypothetical protein
MSGEKNMANHRLDKAKGLKATATTLRDLGDLKGALKHNRRMTSR